MTVRERRVLRYAGAPALLAALLRCASRMNGRIADLLDSARQESRQSALRLEPVDLRAWLAGLVERCAPVLEPGRIRLAIEPGGAMRVLADPGRLERVVLNLLLNALKLSPPEAHVELGAHATDRRVTVSVTDHGRGIPASDLPHLFERFYRGHAAPAPDGLELGLYGVRRLVEAHGGTVRAVPGRGGGTCFLVSLPVAERAAAAGQVGAAATVPDA